MNVELRTADQRASIADPSKFVMSASGEFNIHYFFEAVPLLGPAALG